MLALCELHVGKMPGCCYLMGGDITQLEKLLPDSEAVQLLKLGEEVKLPHKVAWEFFTALNELNDHHQLSDDPYYRSTMHPDQQATPRELVEALVTFLDSELKHH